MTIIKKNNLSPNTSEIIEEKQELSSEVSNFMKNIDFKEILREVRPYILYIPHPAALLYINYYPFCVIKTKLNLKFLKRI